MTNHKPLLTPDKLREYQLLIANHQLSVPRSATFAGMGLGKGVSTLTAIDSLIMAGEDAPTLVLGPKRVAKTVWVEEAAKWSHTKHLRVVPIMGTEKERLQATRYDAEIFTTNYENIPWLVEHYGDRWPFRTVVADECFVSGTMIQCDGRTKAIESLSVGELVATSNGLKEILRVIRKTTKEVVKVSFSDGNHVVCTGSHRFWTESGWVDAQHVSGHTVFRQTDLPKLPARIRRALAEDRIPFGTVLQPQLRHKGLDIEKTKRVLAGPPRNRLVRVAKEAQIVERRAPAQQGNPRETERDNESARGRVCGYTRRERNGHVGLRRADVRNSRTRMGVELRRKNETFGACGVGRSAEQLQAGLRMAGSDDCAGDRRNDAQFAPRKDARCEKDCCAGGVRVDSVTVEERSGETAVFDLEVRGAHNYFANGVLVHNCSRLKSFRLRQGGQRAAALGKVAHTKIKRFAGLTGTPAPNGLQDLWGQIYFLDRGNRLGRTFDAFKTRWFKPSPDGFGSVAMPHAQAEIQELIKDICITIDAKDYFDLKAPIVRNIEVDLPRKVRELYDEMEKNYFMQLECGAEIEAFNGAAKSMKLLQLCSGAAYLDEAVDSDNHPKSREFRVLHDEKLDALDDIMEETGGTPILVAYQFKSDLARLQKKYPHARLLSDDKQLAEFKTGKFQLGLGHPAAMGHGVDQLQNHCFTMVNYSLGWNLENHEQMYGRIGPVRQIQAGFDRNVFVYNLVARDTIDEVVAERLESKASVQDALLEAMKRRREK